MSKAAYKKPDPGHLDFQMLQIGGLNIRVGVRAGAQKCRPLLIFNGIGSNSELLKPFIAALDDITVITFDAPGTGQSDRPMLPRRPAWVAKLAANILDQLGYGEVNVLGVSWGGAVAQEFAWKYKRRCKRLILAASATGQLAIPGNPLTLMRMAMPGRYMDPEFWERNAGLLYGGIFTESPELVREHMNRASAPNVMGYFFQQLALFSWTSVHWLHLIKQPTLILAGKHDPLVPMANAQLLSWMIPNSSLHKYACGHLFLVTRPEEVAATVRPFLLLGESD